MELSIKQKNELFTGIVLAQELKATLEQTRRFITVRSFEICDNVRSFTKNDWKSVVSVFVQGDDWEFKDWPKGENVTTILQKVKGFHLKYQDLPTNPNVKKWNVKILEISRNKTIIHIF